MNEHTKPLSFKHAPKGLKADDHEPVSASNPRYESIEQDEAFQAAMRIAIRKGYERATEGVVKTPDLLWGVLRVSPAFNHLGGQSIAGELADIGSGSKW